MTAQLYATPYEQEMLHLSRVILQDRNSPMHLKAPALAVLECSEAEADIARCKEARTELQVAETRELSKAEMLTIGFPVKSQEEIDAEDLGQFIETMQTLANRAVIGAVVVLGAAFVIGQAL